MNGHGIHDGNITPEPLDMPSSHLASTRPIQHIARLVEELGGDIDVLCREVGVERAVIEDMQAWLPYSKVVGLMEQAAILCQRPDFGLLLTDIQQPINLGALGLLIRSGDTLGENLEYVSRFYHIQNQSVKIILQRGEAISQFIRDDLWLGKLATFQYCTLTLAHALKAVQYFLGDNWKPAFVTFTYAAPVNRSDYEAYFQCPVEFEQPSNALGIPTQDLDFKLSGASPQVKQHLQRLVSKLAGLTELTLVQNVRHLTRHLLHGDQCTQEYVAQLLQMHPKQLQRALREKGTSFREIRADARLSLAEHFLKDSSIQLTTIAEMLGYSELSAFTRAFKSKHGQSPKDWRRQKGER